MKLIEETAYRFRIEPADGMRVPGIVFASRALLPEAGGEQALQQVANVATLPGIVVASFAMPGFITSTRPGTETICDSGRGRRTTAHIGRWVPTSRLGVRNFPRRGSRVGTSMLSSASNALR